MHWLHRILKNDLKHPKELRNQNQNERRRGEERKSENFMKNRLLLRSLIEKAS